MKKQKETDLPKEEVEAEDVRLNPVIVRGKRRRPKRDGCNGGGSSSGPAGEKTGKTKGGDLIIRGVLTGGTAGGLAGGTRRLPGKPTTALRGQSKENKSGKGGKHPPARKASGKQSGQQGGRNEGGESDSNRSGQRSNGGKGASKRNARQGKVEPGDIVHAVIREGIKGVVGGAAGSLPGGTRRLPGKPTTALHGKPTTTLHGKPTTYPQNKTTPSVQEKSKTPKDSSGPNGRSKKKNPKGGKKNKPQNDSNREKEATQKEARR